MAKVMASNYRYVEQEDDKDYAVRHVLRPGDDPKGLPKDVRDDLEKRGLIVDERRFDARQGVVLPAEEAIQRYEASEAEEGQAKQAEQKQQKQEQQKQKQE